METREIQRYVYLPVKYSSSGYAHSLDRFRLNMNLVLTDKIYPHNVHEQKVKGVYLQKRACCWLFHIDPQLSAQGFLSITSLFLNVL